MGLKGLPSLLTLLLVLGGCGGPQSSEAEAPLQLSVAEPRAELPARLLAELAVPEDLEPWSIPRGNIRHATVDGRPLVLIEGGQEARVVVPGPFDPAEVSRVVLKLETEEPERVRLTFRRGKGTMLTVEGFVLPGEDEIWFQLSEQMAWAGEAMDEVLVRFDGRSPRLVMSGLELWNVPPASLPGAGSGEERWVEVGHDARHGVLLAGGQTLAGRARVAGTERLRVSLGVPRPARSSDLTGQVVVRVGEGADAIEDRITLADLLEPTTLWIERELELTGLKGDVPIVVEFDAPPSAAVGVEHASLVELDADAPLVLLVTSDTHRGDALGFLAGGVSTPTLDALAARGVSYANAWAPTNMTIPSHTSLLTGADLLRTGVITNSDSLAVAADTLAERFAAGGFTCLASVSAAHLHPVSSGLGQGFQRYDSPLAAQRDSVPTMHFLMSSLEAHEGEPLFIWLHVFDAHTPYTPGKNYIGRYYPEDKDPFDESLPELDHTPSWARGVRDREFLVSSYQGEVTYVDEKLGQVFALPRVSRGIIALTADHGEALGEWNEWFHHASVSPAVLHVPLILAWPGLREEQRGLQVRSGVSMTDLGRTLLDLAGLENARFPGRSLVADEVLEGSAREPRFALANGATSAVIEHDGWYLMLHLDPDAPDSTARERHLVELFDLTSDPRCERNLLESDLPRARTLHARLIRWLTDTPPSVWRHDVEASPAHGNMIRQLGYAENKDAWKEDGYIEADCACDHCTHMSG